MRPGCKAGMPKTSTFSFLLIKQASKALCTHHYNSGPLPAMLYVASMKICKSLDFPNCPKFLHGISPSLLQGMHYQVVDLDLERSAGARRTSPSLHRPWVHHSDVKYPFTARHVGSIMSSDMTLLVQVALEERGRLQSKFLTIIHVQLRLPTLCA